MIEHKIYGNYLTLDLGKYPDGLNTAIDELKIDAERTLKECGLEDQLCNVRFDSIPLRDSMNRMTNQLTVWWRLDVYSVKEE